MVHQFEERTGIEEELSIKIHLNTLRKTVNKTMNWKTLSHIEIHTF